MVCSKRVHNVGLFAGEHHQGMPVCFFSSVYVLFAITWYIRIEVLREYSDSGNKAWQ